VYLGITRGLIEEPLENPRTITAVSYWGGLSIGLPLCRETSVSQTSDVSFFSIWSAALRKYPLWYIISSNYSYSQDPLCIYFVYDFYFDMCIVKKWIQYLSAFGLYFNLIKLFIHNSTVLNNCAWGKPWKSDLGSIVKYLP